MAKHPRELQQPVQALFDGLAQAYTEERAAQLSFRQQKQLVLRMLRGVHGRILDVGCGPAMMAEALLGRGFEFWGIDLAPRMVALGRARIGGHLLRARCHLRVGSLLRIEHPEGFFDAAIGMGVLEYLADYRPGLAELARVLRPGGVLVLTVPNRRSPYYLGTRLHEAARRLLRGGPIAGTVLPNRCVPSRLDADLAFAGLERLEAASCNVPFLPPLNRRLSQLGAAGLPAWLGAQYVVKAKKRAPAA